MLRSLAVGLALLRAVDSAQAYAFRVPDVHDFNGVAVDHADRSASEVVSQTGLYDELGGP